MSHSRSALPPHYYAIFGIYEPTLTALGFIGALLDPIKARNRFLLISDSDSGNDPVFFFCLFLGRDLFV